MEQKRLLGRTVIVLALLAVLGAAVPFVGSLGPTAKAGASLPHIDIFDLDVGQYRFQNSPITGRFRSGQLLILRDYGSNLYVYRLPTAEGGFLMPDVHWFRLGGICQHFAPDMEGGKLRAGGVLRCHDRGFSEWWSSEWRWTYQGKNLGEMTDDMQSLKFTVEGSYLVLGKG